jgi:hypothetical protein
MEAGWWKRCWGGSVNVDFVRRWSFFPLCVYVGPMLSLVNGPQSTKATFAHGVLYAAYFVEAFHPPFVRCVILSFSTAEFFMPKNWQNVHLSGEPLRDFSRYKRFSQ